MARLKFEIYNVDGSLHLDLTRQTTKILGQYTLQPGISGEITHPGFSQGIIWWTLAPVQADYAWALQNFPTLQVVGNSLAFQGASNITVPFLVTFGIY